LAVTASTSGEQLTLNGVQTLAPMRNTIRGYEWGSLTALAQLQNRPPSGGPEAELWMGAHPAAPSDLLLDGDRVLPLAEAVERSPKALLGQAVFSRFGARLPFMLKAGESPYVDPYHKPEMLYALEPLEALFGFRTPTQAAMLIDRLDCDRLKDLVETLQGPTEDAGEGELHAALAMLICWPLADRAALVAEIAAGSSRLRSGGNTDYPEAFGWLERLVGLHPADPMVLAPLLLDTVRLAAGQTVFVPAGVPHCYLSGLGLEILAASDNVLRCGLTTKPIEVEELLRVVDCRPLAPSGSLITVLGEHEVSWRPEVEDFQLSRIEVSTSQDGDPVLADASITGPQVIFCARGEVQVQAGGRTLHLTGGHSGFVTAEVGPLTFTGEGEVFRASTGLLHQVPPTPRTAAG
jgi:mannose-6-phosphate isomerase